MTKENSKPHFAKKIDYAPARDEPWRSDFLIGQSGSLYRQHGHLALSGTGVLYFRDESGKVIVEDGSILTNNLQPSSSWLKRVFKRLF